MTGAALPSLEQALSTLLERRRGVLCLFRDSVESPLLPMLQAWAASSEARALSTAGELDTDPQARPRMMVADLTGSPATAWTEVLEAARRHLDDGGWLLLAQTLEHAMWTRGNIGTWQHFVTTLSETGFRLQKEVDVAPTPAAGDTAGSRLVALRLDRFRIRTYQRGDEDALLDLFETSFFHRRGIEHWRWKYQQNPWGQERISVMESPAGEVVGQYCGYPVPLLRCRHGGRERLVAHQVGDTMTARGVRHIGRGPTSLLARAARHFYARWCDHRVAYNFGWNTGNIHKFSLRYVRAEKIEAAPYRVRDLTGQPLQAPSRLRRIWTRYRVSRCVAVDERFDQLLDEAVDEYGLLAERDARYVEWRYLQRPDVAYRLYTVERRGRLVGWGVFLAIEDCLIWGDALFHKDHALSAERLLAAALDDAPPARKVVGWFSERPEWWRREVERLRFEPQPEPDQLALVVVPFELESAPEIVVRELYYTMGDSDLF